MNNQSEAYNRINHAIDELLKARDSLLEARHAFDLGRSYQAHSIAEKACAALYTAQESIRFASLIGQIMASEKQHAGGCDTFKDAEIPGFMRRQAE